MSDDLDLGLESRVRDHLHAARLPQAPDGLRARLVDLRNQPISRGRRPARGWWAMFVPIAAILVLGLSMLFSGGPAPTEGPVAATARLTLITSLSGCSSLGGCAGYVSLVADGQADAPETRLSGLGGTSMTDGLPATIRPGRYEVRAHLALVSDDVGSGQPPSESNLPPCAAGFDAHAGAVITVTIEFGAEGCTVMVESTATTATRAAQSLPTTVDGIKVMTVSEVLAARAAGELRDEPVALGGFWTDRSIPHSCAVPNGQPGQLQLYCHDGEYGITELDEPIMAIAGFGRVAEPAGPHLTPWFPSDLEGVTELFRLPLINGQFYPPIPIVVVGHFDDPRAADCMPEARQRCLDRLVVDRIAAFDIEAVPTPGVTPTPTPFPSPAPPGLFGPDRCSGDVAYSFVGWTTTDALQLPFDREGHVWAMVTESPVLLGGEGWNDDPNGSGKRYRSWGRRICMTEEGNDGAVTFGAVPGSAYWEWEDGTRTYVGAP